MKRALVVALVIGLIASAMVDPATGKKKKKKKKPQRVEREVEARYDQPAIGTFGAGACFGCPQISNTAEEIYMKAEIEDGLSPTGYVDISWDTDGDGINDTGITVCGATEGFVPVPPATAMAAFPWAFPSPDCIGGSTSGVIKITFSNMP